MSGRGLSLPTIATVLGLVVAIGVAAWLIAGTAERAAARLREAATAVEEPFDPNDLVRVVIRNGLAGEEIAELLREAGVISDARRFRMLLQSSGAASELQAGCYELPRRLPLVEVIRRLRTGDTTSRVLAIPEGLRPEEVAERAIEADIGTPSTWEAALRKVETEPGPPGRPAGTSLVGYLFPAAYPLECNTTPESLLREMVGEFAERVPAALYEEAQRQFLSPHELITLASIVEREAVVKEERAVIASVFLNRIEEEIALGADPTVQFAIATPDSVARYGWWKRALTLDDLEEDSPYNTYLNAGLPPGPIAAPGLEAILATVRPARTDFLYFVAKGDGTHAFARTLAEHNRNVATYQLGR